MVIEKIINFVRKMGTREDQEELPDDVTRDRYLRSLRRERRVQMEEVEKERLKREIAEFKKAREKRFLWGVHEEKQKRYALLKLKKKKKNLINNQGCFFGKSNL